MSGEVVHFEIPADNEARARKFYSSLFGWKIDEVPGMSYSMVSTGAVDEKGNPKEPGYVGGGIGKRGYGGVLEHPMFMISVDEISVVERSIEQMGGKILQKKQPIGDGNMGWTGYFQDSEGNTIGLYQAPRPSS
jgi:predicted enzyme related to lactoylglutathione lyase